MRQTPHKVGGAETSCEAAIRVKPKVRLCEGFHIVDSPAREVGGGIKPGVQRAKRANPRIESKGRSKPAERAAAVNEPWKVRFVMLRVVRFSKGCLIMWAVARSAGSLNRFATDPGAYAPGFMPSRAPRALS
jgi:hypothetical protein